MMSFVNRILFVAAFVGLAASLSATRIKAQDITYNLVNYPAYQNGWSLSGQITTDGRTGVVGTTDIVSWNWTITSGTQAIAASSSDSGSAITQGDLGQGNGKSGAAFYATTSSLTTLIGTDLFFSTPGVFITPGDPAPSSDQLIERGWSNSNSDLPLYQYYSWAANYLGSATLAL
jgi:hypothetical protein